MSLFFFFLCLLISLSFFLFSPSSPLSLYLCFSPSMSMSCSLSFSLNISSTVSLSSLYYIFYSSIYASLSHSFRFSFSLSTFSFPLFFFPLLLSWLSLFVKMTDIINLSRDRVTFHVLSKKKSKIVFSSNGVESLSTTFWGHFYGLPSFDPMSIWFIIL